MQLHSQIRPIREEALLNPSREAGTGGRKRGEHVHLHNNCNPEALRASQQCRFRAA